MGNTESADAKSHIAASGDEAASCIVSGHINAAVTCAAVLIMLSLMIIIKSNIQQTYVLDFDLPGLYWACCDNMCGGDDGGWW